MIFIAGKQITSEELSNLTHENTERSILSQLASAEEKLDYDSSEQLVFELRLRAQTVAAAKELDKSGMDFAIFRKSRCNPDFWDRTAEGGFRLKSGAKPSEAISDIFDHGRKYATECATAMVIVYYRALLAVLGADRFNQVFPKIELMNWHHLDRLLRDVGLMKKYPFYLPGDRRYFANPDVDPLTPEWQGENVIDLNGKLYYGHGVGIYDADTIIRSLNQNRIEDADETAYLMDSAGRPDFKNLYRISQNH
ncbi:Protein-glutamine gamma-glutamyltransferase [Caprobacter fermentans]|uniref:Protein-glutamine gamma-glutamyltransferase n=1 Tax=Caproicibacter fermentans TaxID=2576756 RepID=A0A6N8HZR4_9FIRM|nr:protein-glutamine gamma-glutamyltransferase [Caproicibacter fermentans]MVB11252.1 Protein-glutamine gamma-glutamyltransferase [Caproicibacter fermentans]OCN00113.1 protein-glutamine gamma-glutamyltransferase [Clostridium sp. W14A]QNK41938.1 protein-glutamine gamma-glutamyltransferase [Caproicibacter fermentans]